MRTNELPDTIRKTPLANGPHKNIASIPALIVLLTLLFTGCSQASSSVMSESHASSAPTVSTSSENSEANVATPENSQVGSMSTSVDESSTDNLPSGELARVTAENVAQIVETDEWFSYFREEVYGVVGYEFKFGNISPNGMTWRIGYFESELINVFNGKFEVDREGIFMATLKDDQMGDAVVIKFTVEFLKDAQYNGMDNYPLVITLLSCDDDRFADLVGQRLGYDSKKDYNDIRSQYGL